MDNNKNEIITSRLGGFGGSDAAMFYRIGKNGIEGLTDDDKKRIAVALGLIDYEPIATTRAMEAGNNFEEYLAKHKFAALEHNPLLTSSIKPRNFKIFAHADFVERRSDGSFMVIEAKYTKASLIDTKQTYMPQLQWYYMLGASEVSIAKGTQGFPFSRVSVSPVYKNQNYIELLLSGIDEVDKYCDSFAYTPPQEWGVEMLMPAERKAISVLAEKIHEVKRLENEMEAFKDKILALMLKNDVKKIELDGITLTAIDESTRSTFDKKKLLQDHPEINEEAYTHTSIAKAHLKIKVK